MNLRKIALAVTAFAAVASAPAFGACDAAPTFGTVTGALCPPSSALGGLCAVITPGTNIQARFWGMNQGNFALDGQTGCSANASTTCGVDNGIWTWNDSNGDGQVGWLLDAGIPGVWVVSGDWGGAGQRPQQIDGCPLAPPAGKTTQIMYVGLTDSDAAGNGYFAIGWAGQSAGAKADFDFSITDRTSPPSDTGVGTSDMTLRPVPRPFVQASNKIDTTQRSFTLRSLALADIQTGLYGDNTSNPGEAVQGFKIYTLIRSPRSAAAPSLSRSAWTSASGVLPLGGPDTPITVNCAVDSDVFFAYSIVANSGLELAHVGSSRAGQCGPTIAEPQDPKVKPIDRPKKNVNPNN